MFAAGGIRITTGVAAVVAAVSVCAGATFILFNRARSCGVSPGKDDTGVNSGVGSLTPMPV